MISDRVDVHIIEHPHYDRSESRERLMSQLSEEPVNVHIVKGHPRHIGRGRYDGFMSGSSALCSYVDDDDLIEPGIYTKCLEAFEAESDLDGLCTREVVRDSQGDTCPTFMYEYYDRRHLYDIHHLPVFNRASIAPYLHYLLDLPDGSEHSLWGHMLLNDAKIKHLPEVGYYWHIHEENSGTLRIPVPDIVPALHKRLMDVARGERFKTHLPHNARLPEFAGGVMLLDCGSPRGTKRR